MSTDQYKQPSRFIEGWMTDQYAAGAQPPVGAAQQPNMGARWQDINTAPKDRWILITDDVCWPPDLVRWQSARPERIVNGNLYLAVAEGWFGSPGGRSRFDHSMSATRWCELPAADQQTGARE